jgi:hypothetical protein
MFSIAAEFLGGSGRKILPGVGNTDLRSVPPLFVHNIRKPRRGFFFSPPSLLEKEMKYRIHQSRQIVRIFPLSELKPEVLVPRYEI